MGLLSPHSEMAGTAMSLVAELLPGLMSAAAVAAPMTHSQRMHQQGLEATNGLHREAIQQAKAHHSDEVRVPRVCACMHISVYVRCHAGMCADQVLVGGYASKL